MKIGEGVYRELAARIQYLEYVLAAAISAGYPDGVELPPPSEILQLAGFGPENHL